jgi:hypothetical protein
MPYWSVNGPIDTKKRTYRYRPIYRSIPISAIIEYRFFAIPTDGAANRFQLSPLSDDPFPTNFIVVSPQDLAYFWRNPEHIIRFPYADPTTDLEAFAFILLCEHVPFDSELGLRDPADGRYSTTAKYLGLLDTIDKVRTHMTRHAKYRFASKYLTEDRLLQVASAL